MENISIRSASTQAKVIGTIVSISGALIVVLYAGPPLLTPSSPSVLPNQAMIGSPQSGWVLGGFLLAVDYSLVAVWYIFQVIPNVFLLLLWYLGEYFSSKSTLPFHLLLVLAELVCRMFENMSFKKKTNPVLLDLFVDTKNSLWWAGSVLFFFLITHQEYQSFVKLCLWVYRLPRIPIDVWLNNLVLLTWFWIWVCQFICRSVFSFQILNNIERSFLNLARHEQRGSIRQSLF